MVLAQVKHVAQRIRPTHVPSVRLRQIGRTCIELLARVGIDVVVRQGTTPGLVLIPLTTEHEVRVEVQTLDDRPVQGSSSTDALTLLQRLKVTNTGGGAVLIPLRLLTVHLDVTLLQGTEVTTDILRSDRTETISIGQDRTGTVRGTLVTHALDLRVTRIQTEGHVLGKLLVDLQRNRSTLRVRVVLHTLLVHVVGSEVDLRLVRTTRDREVMVVRERLVVNILLHVVLLHVLVSLETTVLSRSEATNTVKLLQRLGISVTEELRTTPSVNQVIIRIERVHITGRLVELGIAVVVHLYATLLGTLGRDEDYTVSTTGTIDSRRRSILQHVDRLNLIGRDVAHRTRDTIHEDQRLVRLRDRTTTTHANRNLGVGTTVLCSYMHTGELTLQGLGYVTNGSSHDILGRNRSNRTGQVLTTNGLITNNHDILQRRSILFQTNEDLGATIYRNVLGLHTDVRYDQHILLCIRYIQGELAVHIRTRTKRSTFNHNSGTDNRLTIGIRNSTLYSLSLSSKGEAQSQHEGQDKLERKVFHCKKF